MKKNPISERERLASRTQIYPAAVEPECCFHSAHLIQFTTPGNKFVGVPGRLHQCALWRGSIHGCVMVEKGREPRWSNCAYNPQQPEISVQLSLDFGYSLK